MIEKTGFKHLFTLPRRWYKGSGLGKQSARQAWVYQDSQRRFRLRDDAYLPSTSPMTGEIGRIDGFRIIVSPEQK
jgi:hypothetical protein